MRGRKPIRRTIDVDHSYICFKPCGIKQRVLDRIILKEDEMEALRLADFEGLYHQVCAEKMGISRSTFSRTLEKAHKKISDALLHGKAINLANNVTEYNDNI